MTCKILLSKNIFSRVDIYNLNNLIILQGGSYVRTYDLKSHVKMFKITQDYHDKLQ